jgi:hypothetical protein
VSPLIVYFTARYSVPEDNAIVIDQDSVMLLRQFFGAKRRVRENAANPWPHRHHPPLICRHNGWLTQAG